MKKSVLVSLCSLLLFAGCATTRLNTTESGILHIPSFDGYLLEGRLAMPDGNRADKVVVYVNGSGPNTYDNKRQLDEEHSFTYFDLFRDEFSKQGIAFFSYNTRGASISDDPPTFTAVDDLIYRQYVPQNSVKDVVAMIKYLRKLPGLRHAKVILLGWSEGSVIAPLVSQEIDVDGLILCGCMYDDMMTILDWQMSGGTSMVFYKFYFDYDQDGVISPEEFAEDRNGIAAYFGVT